MPLTKFDRSMTGSPAAVMSHGRAIGDHDGDVIAWAGDRPVGLKRHVEHGTLIYLGSPLGPALWAGDPEARQWLSRLSSL